MENNALTHHGVRGMRWGVRRYQNKDGTLTPAGKKRYDREMEKLKERERIVKNQQRTQAKLDKLSTKRKELDEAERAMRGEKTTPETDFENKKSLPPEKKAKQPNAKLTKKPIEKMTDEELQERIDRLNLEKKYIEIKQEVDAKKSNNKQKTDSTPSKKGESFIGEIAKASASNIGRQLGTYILGTGVNKLAKAMGVKNKTVKKKDLEDEVVDIFEDIVNPRKGQKDK